ncbi:UNVERIFIED_CONTAM: hypothetical protein Sradi_1882800 [Sesamum radiatum]|uniref:Endonuclease/exonuclease/phosphatase domain-containing protein n=1 Tax=Sesamum radiatum TaxID=300843 RepID=A0AAW2TY50_SESRA
MAFNSLDIGDPAGSRIWLCWNPVEVDVDILRADEQFIHCSLLNKSTSTRCLITVVYGDCELIRRRNLWDGLRSIAEDAPAEPWGVLGDFNAVLDVSESCGRSVENITAMTEFRELITDVGLVHIPFTGCPSLGTIAVREVAVFGVALTGFWSMEYG